MNVVARGSTWMPSAQRLREQGCNLVPRRPVEVLLAATVLLMPVVPALNDLQLHAFGVEIGAGSFARFAIAAVTPLLMLAGVIPFSGLRGRLRVAIVLFLVFQAVPLLVAGIDGYSLVRALNWGMFIPFAFIDYDAQLRRIVFAAGVLAGCVLVAGVVLQFERILGGVWGGLPFLNDAGLPAYARRYTSFAHNPNDLALIMLWLVVAVFVASQHGDARPLVRAAGGVLACVFAIAIVMAGSRGAMIAFAIPVVALALTGRWRLGAGLCAVAAMAVLVVALQPTLRSAMLLTFDSLTSVTRASNRDISVVSRKQTWQRRLQHVSNPLLGAGYGGYVGGPRTRIGTSEERQRVYRQQNVDNGWLKLVLEEGALGGLLLAFVLAGAASAGTRAVAGGARSSAGVVVSVLLIVFAFRALSVDIFDIPPGNFFVWLLVGLALSIATSAGSQRPLGLRRSSAGLAE